MGQLEQLNLDQNEIADWSELNKLAGLENLFKLTVNSNLLAAVFLPAAGDGGLPLPSLPTLIHFVGPRCCCCCCFFSLAHSLYPSLPPSLVLLFLTAAAAVLARAEALRGAAVTIPLRQQDHVGGGGAGGWLGRGGRTGRPAGAGGAPVHRQSNRRRHRRRRFRSRRFAHPRTGYDQPFCATDNHSATHTHTHTQKKKKTFF